MQATLEREDIGLTEEQRDARSKGVGGSELGILLGLSSFKTPLQLWLEKTGKAADEYEMNENQYFGHVLEPIIAQEFSRRTGLKVRQHHETMRAKDAPWMVGNIDRRVLGRRAGLECKAWSSFTKNEWGEFDGSDEVPPYVAAQCAHYMKVGDFDDYYVACLLGGNDFRWYHLRRRPQLEEHLVEITRQFWQEHVEALVPPPAINLDDLKRLYRAADRGAIEATAEIEQAVDHLRDIKAQQKVFEKEREKLEFEIKAFMGDHDTLLMPEELATKLCTWKKTKDGINVKWEAIAEDLMGLIRSMSDGTDDTEEAAIREIVMKHTKPKEGHRMFLVK